MEGIDSFEKKDMELIHSADIFDTYVYHGINGGKYIIKLLINSKRKGKIFFNNELRILRLISKKNIRNCCKLVKSGDDYYAVEFIPHLKLEQGQVYKYIGEDNKLLEDLSANLVSFNTAKVDDSDMILKDTLIKKYIRALIRAILSRKLHLQFHTAIDLLNCIAFLIAAPEYENWTFVHNDFRKENFLVSEDLTRTYIIDYDRATIVKKFISRDALLLCLHSKGIKEWSWEYTFLQKYLHNLKAVSEYQYKIMLNELNSTKALRYFMIALAIAHINSSDYGLRNIGILNLNLLHDKKEFKIWHRQFISKLMIS